jgi:hypothetical protein
MMSQENVLNEEVKHDQDHKAMKNLQHFRNNSSANMTIPAVTEREGSGTEAYKSEKQNPSNDSYL